jgi:hypothetical protein
MSFADLYLGKNISTSLTTSTEPMESHDNAHVRYGIDDGFSTSALAQSITIQSRIQNLALEESHIFSPTFLNEAQLGFNRNTFIQNQQTGPPTIFSTTGFTTLSENYSKAQIPTSFSGNDTMTLIRGPHHQGRSEQE